MAAALAYQTGCIGQIAALPRSSIARNSFSNMCSTGWTMKIIYMTTVATNAAARPIPSMENRRQLRHPSVDHIYPGSHGQPAVQIALSALQWVLSCY